MSIISHKVDDQQLHDLTIKLVKQEEHDNPEFAARALLTYLAARENAELAKKLLRLLKEHNAANAHLDLDGHDCHLSPEDGCEVCEAEFMLDKNGMVAREAL